MPSLSRECERSLYRAVELATERHHQQATLEHLALALTDDVDVRGLLVARGADVEALRALLQRDLEQQVAAQRIDSGETAEATLDFQHVVQRAVLHVVSAKRAVVTGVDILLSLLMEKTSHATHLLEQQDVSLARRSS